MEKQQVVALLKGIETGDPAAFTVINPNKYIQHQLRAADGLDGLKEVAERAAGTAKVNTIRVYKDGDYVFTHTEYDIFGPKIGFDIFRFENGLIVEHWSNLQTTVPGPNPFSGRTMTDGPTRAVDLQQTEVNKAAVRGLLDDRIAGRFEKLAGYFVDGVYIQHNPTIDTSLKGLAVLGIDGPVYERIHLVLGEGNFVLSTTEGSLKGVPTAYFDLFRLENGKIREHWDVIETIPPREEHRNGNGKFWAAEKPMTNDFKNGNLVNGNGSPSTATTSNGTNKVTQEDLANGKPKASITNHNSTEKQEDLANGKPKASITNHNSTEKQQVVDLLKAIETGEQGPFEVIHPSRYIQHNLLAADGLEGVRGLMKLVSGSAKVNTVRVFQDGDYVFAHTDYDFFGPNIGFDIFRFDNGLIVEHWDNLQATPAGKNPSGHTMLDGPTDQTEKPKFVQTNANKALVRNFVNDMLINRRLEKLNDYYKGDEYVQHNPAFGDGVSALGPAFKAMAAASQNVKYTRIHLVLADGNFVLVVSEGAQGQNPTSFYDLFRVEKGKIVEHWDVVETIPPREQWQNDNGKF
ncbi:hypothetical protein BV898_14028 [Hypsibius exemplaris]|uniref:SnoaL-like domain-containing protein n=1 Tax=Hypsibius exemplaris TaxID=2072580 RepID=A0A1W0W8Z9_HYPEX|nr:hypothetical protein BV898_14028 [Hypsibius exemplaris]